MGKCGESVATGDRNDASLMLPDALARRAGPGNTLRSLHGWNSGGKTCNRNGHVFPVRRTDRNIESVHFGPPSVLFCFGRNGKVTSQSRVEGSGRGSRWTNFNVRWELYGLPDISYGFP